jgi:hypothetical protein
MLRAACQDRDRREAADADGSQLIIKGHEARIDRLTARRASASSYGGGVPPCPLRLIVDQPGVGREQAAMPAASHRPIAVTSSLQRIRLRPGSQRSQRVGLLAATNTVIYYLGRTE